MMRLVYLILLLPLLVRAQPKGWQGLTISDGLSQGMVFDIRQDRNGFVWIATKDGLNRFDGYNVTVFTHDPENPFSLSGNGCPALLIDRHKRLWVGTLNQGLNLFDDRTQRFHHITISTDASPDANNDEITRLYEAPDGAIWVVTNTDRLYKITLPDNLPALLAGKADLTPFLKIEAIPVLNGQPAKRSFALGFRHDGQVWIATFYGLYAIDGRKPGKAVKLTDPPEPSLNLTDMLVNAGAGYACWANNGKLHLWHKGVIRHIALPAQATDNVRIRWIDGQTVAVATNRYLWLLPAAGLLSETELTIAGAYTPMPPDLYQITGIMRDATNMIWLGTAGYGARRFNPAVRQFQTWLPAMSLTNLLQDRRGTVYVRYVEKYGRLNKPTNQVTPLPDAGPGVAERCLFQDAAGNFWVSRTNTVSGRHMLVKYAEDWQLRGTYLLPAGCRFGFVSNKTIVDKAGSVWLGVSEGQLLRFTPATGTFQVYSYRHLLPRHGAEIETFALYIDARQTLWIGTQQGLIKATHPTTGPAFTAYRNEAGKPGCLSENFVSALTDDPYQPDRYLWVATKGGGLNRLDKQTNRFTAVTEKDGLPNKVVYGILPDDDRQLWISTNRGIARFNPQTRQFRTFSKADGLQDDEFNTNSYTKAPSGELLFGGVNGLTVFRPSEVIKAADNLPQAHIISLKVNNKPVVAGGEDGILTAPVEQTGRIALAHDQNLLTLEFSVMDYTNPARNQYRYRLTGIDQDWVEAGTNHFANYAQLPDGHYTLEMTGSVDGQVWSKPVVLQVRVFPPFYRSWWAYLLYGLILAGIGWQLYRFQKQRWQLQQQVVTEQEEARRFAELDALKTQFFTNISHEFRTPLTLIMAPMEDIIRDYAADRRFPLIQQHARRLLTLINQLLDLSKLEAGQLRPEPKPGDLVIFFRTLVSAFSSLAESRGIRFRFVQDETGLRASFDHEKLETVFANLLSNAFKFTPSGKAVEMRVDYSGNEAVIKVADEGIGIAADKLPHIFERFYQGDGKINRAYEGTGIGLALVKELVQVLGGRITVESAEGSGTTFTVHLPIEPVPAGGDHPETDYTITAFSGNDFPANDLHGPVSTGEPEMEPEPEQLLLIIDDNADIRAYVRSIFRTGYRITEAVDGQQGLEKATELLPDIVICDLMMPRLDGFGFCRMLKAQPVTSHIPVVMLTAKATVEDRIEGYGYGADDYLTKPFHPQEIRMRVRNLLEQRQRLFAWFASRITAVPAADTPVPLVAEQKFIDDLKAVVMHHLDDTAFSVEVLAEAANLSRSQLHRKLKVLTGDTPTHFIREVRLTQAAILLSTGEQPVIQVGYAVGFDNPSYFAKLFQERFGVLPSQYQKPASAPK